MAWFLLYAAALVSIGGFNIASQKNGSEQSFIEDQWKTEMKWT